MLDTVTDLGALENVALLSNAADNGFVGVNLYADDEGQALGLPRNRRACEIAACAGKPLDVCGDAFLARVMDSDAEFARLDLALDEVSSSAPWVKAAAAQNARKAASESAEVRLARVGGPAAAKAPPARPAPPPGPPPCSHREAGNTAFGQGRWGDAAAHYAAAVAAAPPGSPAALAALNNRAAALLKAGDAEGAERDATAVLASRPGDVKTLLRRGAAREARGDRPAAAADFRAAAAAETGNTQAAEGVARCSGEEGG
jgi:tetratricopeptide (TPR) repeat protein